MNALSTWKSNGASLCVRLWVCLSVVLRGYVYLRVVFVQVRRVGNALADSSCTNTQLRDLQRLQ